VVFCMSKLNEIGISVEQNKAGFHILHVKNAYCEMSVSLYGGHIMSYIPVGQRDLLWMSSNAFFAEGQAIRGGIPVCWPWFGSVSQPAHGTARIHSWQLADAFLDADGETILILRYNEFSMDLSLEMRVHAGRSLLVELITNNHGSEEKHITEALHTYL